MKAEMETIPSNARTRQRAKADVGERPVAADAGSASRPVRSSPRRLRRLLIVSDVVAIVVGVVVATLVQQMVKPVSGEVLVVEILLGVVIVPVWVLAMGANQLFLARAISRFGEELRRLLAAGLMAIGFLLAVSFAAQYQLLSRLWVGLLLRLCDVGADRCLVSRLGASSTTSAVRVGSVAR
jgi:hypothetical protein